jgi:hypothetical protein
VHNWIRLVACVAFVPNALAADLGKTPNCTTAFPDDVASLVASSSPASSTPAADGVLLYESHEVLGEGTPTTHVGPYASGKEAGFNFKTDAPPPKDETVCVTIPASGVVEATYCGAAEEQECPLATVVGVQCRKDPKPLLPCILNKDCPIGWIKPTHITPVRDASNRITKICVTFSNESKNLTRHVGVIVRAGTLPPCTAENTFGDIFGSDLDKPDGPGPRVGPKCILPPP